MVKRTIVKRSSRRIGPETVTDLDFADDIVLLSEGIDQAQEILKRVETSVGKVGLKFNAGKTNYMAYIKAQTSPSRQMKDHY